MSTDTCNQCVKLGASHGWWRCPECAMRMWQAGKVQEPIPPVFLDAFPAPVSVLPIVKASDELDAAYLEHLRRSVYTRAEWNGER